MVAAPRNPSRSFLIRLAVVALGLQVQIAAGVACGGPTGQTVQAHAAEAFEYERPIAEVWPELVQILKESQLTLKEAAPAENRTFETDQKPEPTNPKCTKSESVRYARIDAKRYTLHMWADMWCPDAADGGVVQRMHFRDWENEWELVQRAEPVRASAIRQRGNAADARRQESEQNCASGCGAGCAACGACITLLAPQPPPK